MIGMNMVKSTQQGAFLMSKRKGVTKGLAKKLKNLKIHKVDFVDEGANQLADINLYKRKEPEEKPHDSIFKRCIGWLRGEGMDDAQINEEIQKVATSFNEQIAVRSTEEITSEIWNVLYALRSSLESVIVDPEIDATSKPGKMIESIGQFTAAMQEYVPKWCSGQTAVAKSDNGDLLKAMEDDYHKMGEMIGKMKSDDDPGDDPEDEDDDEIGEGAKKGVLEKMLKIDKSKMTPEEVAAYDEIIKKYAVDEPDETPGAAQEQVPENIDKSKEGAPAAQAAPPEPVESEIVKALKAQIEETRKSLNAMREEALTKEVTEVAKKYAPLGKKVEDLVPVLKQMKAGGEALYKNYVELLDQQLDIQKSSGIFTEFGKSTTGDATGDPEKMWIAKAKELQKAKPDLTLQQAMDEVALTDDELRAQIDQ